MLIRLTVAQRFHSEDNQCGHVIFYREEEVVSENKNISSIPVEETLPP